MRVQAVKSKDALRHLSRRIEVELVVVDNYASRKETAMNLVSGSLKFHAAKGTVYSMPYYCRLTLPLAAL